MMSFAAYAALALVTDGACLLAANAVLSRALHMCVRMRYTMLFLAACTIAQTFFLREQHDAWRTLTFLTLTGVIAVSALTDAATGYVLDILTLPALGIALTGGAISNQFLQVATGASAGALSILVLYAISAGSGVGLGDVKLAACVGALLGAERGFVAMGVAFIAGGVYAAFLLLTRRGSRKDSLPLAPFLAAGVLATLALRSA